MRKREITPLSETFLKAFDKRMDVVEEAEQIDESVKFNGKTFKDYKTFNSDKEANAYLEKHDDYGVIGKKDGKIFAAKMSDLGEAVEQIDEAGIKTAYGTTRTNTYGGIKSSKPAPQPGSKEYEKWKANYDKKKMQKSQSESVDEAASIKDDPSHSKNPFTYTKKPTNKKEAQGNVNYWHYVGMASNKEIEDMGEVPANYKSYAKSMMQDAQRELKKFNEEVEVKEAYAVTHKGQPFSYHDTEDEAKKHMEKYAKKGDASSYKVVKEGLDAVGKEDDDVDNDGDTDSSDRYLKKRRAAISKAVKESILDESAKKMSGTYAIVEYDYKDDFWHVEVVKDGKSVASQNGYFGANAVGNPLITKFVEMVKKAGLKPEGMKIVSDWEDHMEGVFKNNTFNWKK